MTRHFFLRVKTAWHILTQKKKHWILLSVTEDDLYNTFGGKEYTVDIVAHKLQPYTYFQITKDFCALKDASDMDLLKAEMFAKAELRNNEKLEREKQNQ